MIVCPIESAIILVEVSERGVPWTSKTGISFHETPCRPEHPVLEELRETRIPKLRQHAAERGQVLFDGPRVDLTSAELVTTHDGRSEWRCGVASQDRAYLDWFVSSRSLDEPFHESTLREHLNIYPTRWQDVADLPVQAGIGAGTCVVTRDSKLVLGVRSGRCLVATGDGLTGLAPVTEACEPSDRLSGRFDPRAAAMRGLREELGLRAEHVMRLEDAGVGFDRGNLGTAFSYVAHINMDFKELTRVADEAQDGWESSRMVAFDYDVSDPELFDLLTGTSNSYRMVSTHVAALLWCALAMRHGSAALEDLVARRRRDTAGW